MLSNLTTKTQKVLDNVHANQRPSQDEDITWQLIQYKIHLSVYVIVVSGICSLLPYYELLIMLEVSRLENHQHRNILVSGEEKKTFSFPFNL